MQIGPRNWRIVILQPQSSKNGVGETITTGFTEYARPWAEYHPVSDGERMRAAALEQKTDARFRVLWSPQLATVTGAFRLRFDGADWQIVGVKTIGYRDALEFTAWRVKSAGGSDGG